MNKLLMLRRVMEKAFVEGNPKALQLSQELDKLIVAEQTAMLKQGGHIIVMVRPEKDINTQCTL